MPTTPDPALLEQLRAALDAGYDIERELSGGMSRVFVATERALNRRVVIKVLPPELTAGVNRDRFRREIQFAARLQHPHIVPLLTAGQVGEILYYTMPLVEGETLRARLERERRLPAATVVGILQDIVDALAYAHGQGLIHRDIKPENILLQRHHALVTDFGVAKAISEALPGTAATTVGVAVGTPAYMAPEQLAADPAADHRIDLYAIGLVAYELLSGESPFSGSSPQQTLARQLTERPTPPHLRRTDVPAALSDLIMRCLEKDATARFGSAEELLQALGAIRITASGMPAVARTVRQPATRPARRPLLVGIASITLVGVLIAGGYAYWTRGTPAAAQPGAQPVADLLPVDTLALPDSVPTRPGLTRADSEAIAAAVARQMPKRQAAQSPGLTAEDLDSLRQELARVVTDSLMRVLGPSRQMLGTEPGRQPVGPEGLRELPNATGSWRMFGTRYPFRVALTGFTDGLADRRLAPIAGAIADSLAQYVIRRPAMQLLPPEAAREMARTGLKADARQIAVMLGAHVVIEGTVRSAKGDSIEVVFGLTDVRDRHNAKTVRRAVPEADAEALPATVLPLITAWLNQRESATRGSRTLTIPKGLSVDSAVIAAMRRRDSAMQARRQPPPVKPPTA